MSQILEYGRVIRPAIGITIGPPQLLKQLGVEGVLVMQASIPFKFGLYCRRRKMRFPTLRCRKAAPLPRPVCKAPIATPARAAL